MFIIEELTILYGRFGWQPLVHLQKIIKRIMGRMVVN